MQNIQKWRNLYFFKNDFLSRAVTRLYPYLRH